VNGTLDRLLSSLARRQPHGQEFPAPIDGDAAALEEELRLADEPSAQAFVGFLDAHGLSLARPGDVRELAAMILDECEQEEARVRARLATAREVAAREGGGRSERSVEWLEAQLEELQEISGRVFGAVRKPLVRGAERPHVRRCRDCRREMTEAEAFAALGGYCRRCLRDNNNAPAPAGAGGLLDGLLEALG
jgi:hypothetical protein